MATITTTEPTTGSDITAAWGAAVYADLNTLNDRHDFAGKVAMFAGASGSIPDGYLLCDGSAVSRATYSDLFTAIGTTWGAGNGSTTFNLPDLRDRFIVGAGSSYALTAAGGATTNNLEHTHSLSHTHGVTSNVTVGNHGDHTHSTPAHQHYLGIGWESGAIRGIGVSSGNYNPVYGHREVNVARQSVASSGATSVVKEALSENGGASTTGSGGGASHSVTNNAVTSGGASSSTTSSGLSSTQENRPLYKALFYVIKY